MKKFHPFVAVLLAASSTAALAQMPPGPMKFVDAKGSVLTLNGPGPTTSGTYTDKVGMAGCGKGKTYQIPKIETTGAPMQNGTLKFQIELCNKTPWVVNATIQPPTGPSSPMPTLVAHWTLTISGGSTYTAQPPQGMPPAAK